MDRLTQLRYLLARGDPHWALISCWRIGLQAEIPSIEIPQNALNSVWFSLRINFARPDVTDISFNHCAVSWVRLLQKGEDESSGANGICPFHIN